MGKYSNINVKTMLSNANILLDNIKKRENNLSEIYCDLTNFNYFLSCRAANKAAYEIEEIRSSTAIEGSVKNIKKQLEKIIKGLKHIQKYQELEKEYKIAQKTTNSLKQENEGVTDAVALQIAKAAESRIKSQMEKEERQADSDLS